MEKANQKLEIITKYFADLSELQIKQLNALEDLYKSWNQKINVISRKDIDELYLHHVLHSLSIATLLENEENIKIVDIGCGGGFPGIPLAIFNPKIQFYLVDSIAKKLKVVENICENIELKNVIILNKRIEELKNYKFDIALSRGVAPLNQLWNWSQPLLKKYNFGGKFKGLVCLKGGDLNEEISMTPKKVNQIPIIKIFPEDYFQEKYILTVQNNS